MQQPVAPSPLHSAATADSAPAAVAVDLYLDWIGTPGHKSCPLETVWRDPSLTRGIAGVYLIWSASSTGPNILYVGNGRDIGALLQSHHADPRIAGYAGSGNLNVSWAAVASIHRPGVAQYLTSALSPLIAATVPVARAVSVNLPI